MKKPGITILAERRIDDQAIPTQDVEATKLLTARLWEVVVETTGERDMFAGDSLVSIIAVLANAAGVVVAAEGQADDVQRRTLYTVRAVLRDVIAYHVGEQAKRN